MWIILAIIAFYIGLYIGDKSKFDVAMAPVRWFCTTVIELFNLATKPKSNDKPTDQNDHNNR